MKKPVYSGRNVKEHGSLQVYESSALEYILNYRHVQEAKKRVSFVGNKYRYTPSEEYKQFLASQTKSFKRKFVKRKSPFKNF